MQLCNKAHHTEPATGPGLKPKYIPESVELLICLICISALPRYTQVHIQLSCVNSTRNCHVSLCKEHEKAQPRLRLAKHWRAAHSQQGQPRAGHHPRAKAQASTRQALRDKRLVGVRNLPTQGPAPGHTRWAPRGEGTDLDTVLTRVGQGFKLK